MLVSELAKSNMKRSIDLIGSIVGIIIFAPLMLIIAIGVRLTSKGEVVFRQKRVGLNGQIFKMFKFRSMIVGADKLGPYYTTSKDARITWFGRYIRKTSLDELPQLFNVFKGDMSLVGPRPDVYSQKSNYQDAEWEKRCSVKPGLTGLAQALLRSEASIIERLELDLFYVKYRSTELDMYIIAITIRQVLFKGGY